MTTKQSLVNEVDGCISSSEWIGGVCGVRNWSTLTTQESSGLVVAASLQMTRGEMVPFCIILSLVLCCYHFAECAEMNVQGSEYIKYDLFGTNASIVGTSDTLSLRFKTVQPHGLLFYAHGVGYITLELHHCKLRFVYFISNQ